MAHLPGDHLDSLAELTRFTSPTDAQLLHGCLEAEGIPAFLGNVDTMHALSYMGGAVGVPLRVPSRLLAEARAVMKAWEAGEYALDEDGDYAGGDGETP
jgi:hypothetical protein